MELVEIVLNGSSSDVNNQLKNHLPNALCLGAISNRFADGSFEYQVLGRGGFPVIGWLHRPKDQAKDWFLKFYR